MNCSMKQDFVKPKYKTEMEPKHVMVTYVGTIIVSPDRHKTILSAFDARVPSSSIIC